MTARRAVLLALGAAMALQQVWAAPADAAPAGAVPLGQPLGEAYMQGLGGPTRKLSDFRGKPLLINVWASWCGPCLHEMDSLQRLHQRFGGRQLQLIGISTDDYRDKALGFVRKTGISFPNFIDNGLFLERLLGADRLPLTVLVDAEGRVLSRTYGARAWDSAEQVAFIARTLKVRL